MVFEGVEGFTPRCWGWGWGWTVTIGVSHRGATPRIGVRKRGNVDEKPPTMASTGRISRPEEAAINPA
jgi:hypothetical protein